MLCIRARLQSGRIGPNKIRALAPGLFSAQNSFWASKFGQDTRIGLSPCYGAFCTKCSSGAQGLNMLREKASLHEGHGFSRAIKGLRTTALAAEVRLFDTYGATSSLSAAVFAADDWKDVPQRLKASSVRARCGTAEPVPLCVKYVVALRTALKFSRPCGTHFEMVVLAQTLWPLRYVFPIVLSRR
jgi:hypothetical protein